MFRLISSFLTLAAVFNLVPHAAAQSYMGAPSADGSQVAYGSSVGIAGQQILVAEPTNDYASGLIYVYEKSDGEWKETAKLAAPDAQWADNFGASIHVSDETLVVGATNQEKGAGAVYLFNRSGDGPWTFESRLVANAPTIEFGRSVDIDGDWLLIGSSGNMEEAGYAFVFRRGDDGKWTEHSALRPDSAMAMTGYASNVAFANGMALIAAPSAPEGGLIYTYQYDSADDAWVEVDMLAGSEGAARDRFGMSIAVSGDEMLIGAPGASQRAGVAYFYEYDDEIGTWVEKEVLKAFDNPLFAAFGSALAFNGQEVWVGAPLTGRFRGTIYVYSRRDGEWTGVNKVSDHSSRRGDFFGGALQVSGDVAAVGIRGADFGSGRVAILERTSAGWEPRASLAGADVGLEPIVGDKVMCSDGKADIFTCQGVDMISMLPVKDIGGSRGVRVNDMWGWEDPATGREYAIVGRVDGTSFVDITDASHPKYLGDLPRTKGTPPSVWRDIKVYKNHAFIVADGAGEHGIQIFDLTQLRNIENAPVTFKETARYDKIHSSHNIVINESTGFGYAVGNSAGGETCGGGLHMLDLSNPVEPKFMGCFADETTGRRNTGYSHDAQCVIYSGPDVDYSGREICFGSNETAISIADVTDKNAPVAVATANYPNVAYTHQGWLTEDHKYFLVNDEGDEPSGLVKGTRTLIWDVQDLDDPQLLVEYVTDNPATDHNLYIKGNLVFESNYRSGLRILDISDIENPVEVGYFDTVPFGSDEGGSGGSWSNYPYFKNGVIGVTSGREGLFLLKRQEEGI